MFGGVCRVLCFALLNTPKDSKRHSNRQQTAPAARSAQAIGASAFRLCPFARFLAFSSNNRSRSRRLASVASCSSSALALDGVQKTLLTLAERWRCAG